MGFRVSWLAVRGSSPEAIHAALGLTVGRSLDDRMDHPFEFDTAGAVTRRGWYVVTFGTCDHRLFSPLYFGTLSRGGELFACYINETVMDTDCQFWRDGAQQWSVTHRAETGQAHLQTDGPAPAVRIERLRQSALAKDVMDAGNVDHTFDVPLLLAWRETGFKHDRTSKRPQAFTSLIAANRPTAVTPKSMPRWKFW
jgi:hypothetical protein